MDFSSHDHHHCFVGAIDVVFDFVVFVFVVVVIWLSIVQLAYSVVVLLEDYTSIYTRMYESELAHVPP